MFPGVGVPGRGALAVLVPGTLDLVGGCGHAPVEAIGEPAADRGGPLGCRGHARTSISFLAARMDCPPQCWRTSCYPRPSTGSRLVGSSQSSLSLCRRAIRRDVIDTSKLMEGGTTP